MTVIIPVLVLAVLFLVVECAHFHVYGWFIKEEELDHYLGKHLPTATLNPFSEDGTLFSDMPKYVARSSSFLSKYSVERYGTIPRWSKWTRKLDEKRAELLAERGAPIAKTLKDY